jgi:hypothetical protein
MALNRRGFVPGDTVYVTGEIRNNGSSTIGPATAYIIRV